MKYTGIFTPCEEGGWIAKCAEIPGALTQGETLEEAEENLKDAIKLMLESNAEDALRDIEDNSKVVTLSIS